MDKEQEKRWFDLTDEMLKRLNERLERIEFLQFKIKKQDEFIKQGYEISRNNSVVKDKIRAALKNGVNMDIVADLIDEIE